MNSPLFLLYCLEMGALLCGVQSGPFAGDFTTSQSPVTTGPKNDIHSNADTILSTDPSHVASSMSTNLVPTTDYQDSNSPSTSRSPDPQPTITSTSTSTTTSTTANSPINAFYKKECLPVFMMAGGLIIACAILLISTVLLMCKVCWLSRHIKMLSNNADLISTSEYWMGTAKKSKSTQETDAKETTVLMADIGQTQGDVGNGAAKEEAAKANEDGPAGEEDQKDVGDAAKSEEASSTPVVGNASSSEEATDSQATDSQAVKAGAAPSSKGTEEPKEEV